MTNCHGSSARFTLAALSLMLIVLSVFVPALAAPMSAEFAAPADRGAEVLWDTFELTDDLAPLGNIIHVAWSPVISALALTAVIEWAWSLTPPVHPPIFSHSI